MILAGDIGGTHARLAIAEAGSGRLVSVAVYRVAAYADLNAVLRQFLGEARPARDRRQFDRACFAVAGPIDGRSARLTNAPWTVDADAIASEFGIRDVRLANDFAAAAAGIDTLGPGDLATLQPGAPLARSPRLVIGPGTGLGVAVAVWSDGCHRVMPGEGGHVGFAPRDDEQVQLWHFLHRRIGRVQAEDIVSGPGLVNLYAFTTSGLTAALGLPEDIKHDGAAAVTRRAFTGNETPARKAIALFAACFGAIAGDHALTVLPRAGVYLAGGITPRLLDDLKAAFLAGFNDKGSHAPLMRSMPVHVVLEDQLGLRGAAWLAAHPSD